MVERKGPSKGKFGGGFGGKPGGARSSGPRAGGRREGGFERKPREGGERSYAPRADGERKPYVKREGGFDRKPREGGYERKSFGDGERKPYAKREGGFERKPREGGYERKSFGDGERKPYVKREGGFDRKPREGGYERKSFGDGERKPFVKREGGFDRPSRADRGEAKPARFSEKRNIKRDRTPVDKDAVLLKGDGWLVGYHAVLAALSAGRRKVRKVWLLSEAQGELAAILERHPDWSVEIKAKPDFDKEFGDAVHQGVAALVGNLPQPSLPELLSSKPKLIVALDQITDPHNLGAIVRSAAAFGAAGVLVTEHRAAGLNLTAAKVAAGAMEVVPVVEVTNLVQSLTMMQEAGFTVLGMAGEAEAEIGDVAVKGPVCLVMGSEGEGLRRLTRETCDQLVKIAIAPVMESLNVSVATGVALSILTRK